MEFLGSNSAITFLAQKPEVFPLPKAQPKDDPLLLALPKAQPKDDPLLLALPKAQPKDDPLLLALLRHYHLP